MNARAVDIRTKVVLLSRPDLYPDSPRAIQRIETHMSWIFLTDRHAYKLKKPVRYEFLDFSTPLARRRDCEKEVRLNRRLAPDVYLGVVPLVINRHGDLELEGEGDAVDWLVKMRRLPEDCMLDRHLAAGTVSPEDADRLARRLVRFYDQARIEPLDGEAYRRRYAALVEQDFGELLDDRFSLPTGTVETVRGKLLETLGKRPALFHDRTRRQLIREGHGDLRPEHICLADPPVIIDCLEFNRAFRLLDPADELAFLALECHRLGSPEFGRDVLSAYTASSGDRPPPALVDFYTAYRAGLRAKLSIRHILDLPENAWHKWRDRAAWYLDIARERAGRL